MQIDLLRRRDFVALLGGTAAAWPFAARAQQPTMPVIGLLGSSVPGATADWLHAFRQGLKGTGFVEGENVLIEYRWAENRYERLPSLAAELVHRQVAILIALGGAPAVFAAKAATTTIPIVFSFGDDPVRAGLVASLARPGGNLTGINFLATELVAKRLELLRELVPGAARVAVLVNPANPTFTGTTTRDVDAAARAMGLQIRFLNASTSGEIDAAFGTFVNDRPDAVFVGGDAFFTSRRVQLATLATRYVVPMTSAAREITDAGGLMSYGSDIADAWRQVGVYAGESQGENPADLPVVQASKFELVINTQTARILGLNVPPTLLALADAVIE